MKVLQKPTHTDRKYGAAYAYEYNPNLVPNTGQARDLNQTISDTLADAWTTARNGISHAFQDTENGVAPATGGAAAVLKTGSLARGAYGVAIERGIACVNCHIEEAIEVVVNAASAPSDTTQTGQ
jgi:hypothetical protein